MNIIKTTAIVLALLFAAGTTQACNAAANGQDNFILVRGGGGHGHGGGGHGHAGHWHGGGHGHWHGGGGWWGGVGLGAGAVILGAPYLYDNTPSTYICGYDAYGNAIYCNY